MLELKSIPPHLESYFTKVQRRKRISGVNAYIGHLVLCFREVWRVMREDAVCWIVIGDSFSNGQRGGVYDISDKEPEDSPSRDCPSQNQCDVYPSENQTRKSHSDDQHTPTQAPSPSASSHEYTESESDHLPTLDSTGQENHSGAVLQDRSCVQALADEQPHGVLASNTPSVLQLCLDASGQCAERDQKHEQPHSSSYDAPPCEHSLACQSELETYSDAIQDQHSGSLCNEVTDDASDRRKLDKVSDSSSCQEYTTTLRQGQLMGIPYRLMLALQADGWICRNDVVWNKVAPMPESVSDWRWERHQVKVENIENKGASNEYYRSQRTGGSRPGGGGGLGLVHSPVTTWHPCPGCDKCEATGGYVLRRGSWRHTRAHETVLMLAKGMGYYSDQERVREENAESSIARRGLIKDANPKALHTRSEGGRALNPSNPAPYGVGGRNPRSVLTPKPESFPGSHYAVFPRTLISPLLRATAPTRVCPVCGAPWAPVVERETSQPTYRPGQDAIRQSGVGSAATHRGGDYGGNSTVLAHRPTCDHNAEPVPGWCLDNFVGSGTTLQVCRELGLNGVGVDLSASYLDEHAKVRASLGSPSTVLDGLPLFEGLDV